jgi:hypothetical protein
VKTEKKTPTWVTVVGILGICFGALGLMGGSYEMAMPTMISMQKKMIESMKESAKEAREKSPYPDKPNQTQTQIDPTSMFETMEDFMSVPPWYSKYTYTNGSLQLTLGALYILASIFLLLGKRGAIPFFLSIAAVSAVRNIVALAAGICMTSFIAFWSMATGAWGFLIDLVLIIVVASSRGSVRREAVS